MTTIMPQGEELRRAVKWISDRRQGPQAPPMSRLIEEAARQFNLSPADEEFLARHLKDEVQ